MAGMCVGGGLQIVRTGISSPPETRHDGKRISREKRDGVFTSTCNNITVRKTRNLGPRCNGRPLRGRPWQKISASPADSRRHQEQAPRAYLTPLLAPSLYEVRARRRRPIADVGIRVISNSPRTRTPLFRR